ncbi:MAG: coproporphyrinogen dehydrogenase HemZ [Oscillospiraceae bacterium]|jgi:oxygen-independent coproporphyrinogen-3 oxidase|nr:coproporphyrinogen dehydrogenase HemZ [Oscillospiraceae bacterium]MDD3260718.1 coproporphyrinogen dehydrogenase HemZ [Oscillospiraceae bacterium]
MDLILKNNSYHYELEKLCRLFYPEETIRVVEDGNLPQEQDAAALTVCAEMQQTKEGLLLTARLRDGGEEQVQTGLYQPGLYGDSGPERQLAELLYRLLVRHTGFTPRWGILTGVRPVKLLHGFLDRWGKEKALQVYQQAYHVSEQKTRLALLTLKNESSLLAKETPKGFSLYIGIPFCPSRCAYCSFVSMSVEKTMQLIPDYVTCLCREIKAAGRVAGELGLVLQSVYMGGGTPTTLSVQQMDSVLAAVQNSFDLSACMEFTVEAGRPDTVTPEKLQGLRRRGVTRISINPQTMQEKVLQAIGRHHTVGQVLEAFSMAREAGFDDINMDLIAGLPLDTPETFADTVNRVCALGPESITVHTLALKRSSRIFQEGQQRASGASAAEMLDYAGPKLLAGGWQPYYLYRQTRILGGLENVGFAKPGFESFYNTVIMDETQSILACGAGAGTKICAPAGGRISRIYNFKYPYEYISRHEEILERKEKVKQVYEEITRA